MAEIKKLQVDGADIYPVTHESAVYDNEGKSIESKYLSSVAYTEGDDIQISGGSSEGGGSVDTSELEAQIEEVEETANWCKNAIGDGNQLLTNNKNTVVEAINEVFQRGNNVKEGLVEALIAQGVLASTSESFESLIAKIGSIEGSGDSGGSSTTQVTGSETINLNIDQLTLHSDGYYTYDLSGLDLSDVSYVAITLSNGVFNCLTLYDVFDVSYIFMYRESDSEAIGFVTTGSGKVVPVSIDGISNPSITMTLFKTIGTSADTLSSELITTTYTSGNFDFDAINLNDLSSDLDFNCTSLYVSFDEVYSENTYTSSIFYHNNCAYYFWISTDGNSSSGSHVFSDVPRTKVPVIEQESTLTGNITYIAFTSDMFTVPGSGDSSSSQPIITATSLPATGEENQLCVITDGNPTSFYFNASSNTTPSDAVTFVCISGNEANYMSTVNEVTNLYNISHCTYNGDIVPVWLYTNGKWINIAMASEDLMGNGIINTTVNDFYRVIYPTYDNDWMYTEGEGLYTSGSNIDYYSSVTTTETINFSEYNQIKVTAKVEASSTYGLALFQSTRALNQLHSSESYATITSYQELSTEFDEYTYDISSWEGEGYLGLVRYHGDGWEVRVTDISLVRGSSSEDSGGSGDTSEGTVLFNSSTDNVGFSQALWTTTDSDANSLLNVGIDSYNKAYVGLNATNYSNGDVGAVRLYKTLQNFNVSQLQSFTYCKIKYTMSYNSPSTWETYDAPTFGFTDGLHDDNVTLVVSKTEQEVTHYFSKTQDFNRSADVTIFFTMPLVGRENIRFTITEITLYSVE